VNPATGIITALAGNENPGTTADGQPAVSGLLHDPRSVCIDNNGNLYIAESAQHRIRRIDPTGIITTVAGTGVAGFSGDGSLATAAMLNTPFDVKTDNHGNLFIADYENFRVRKVNLATGIITTIAGNGSSFYSGDGGQAINAGLALPTSVCADANGNIYISEARPMHSSRIRKISPAGIITTIAGSAAFTSTGDGGPAINATMMSPCGLATDASGNIYFSDAEAARIRKITIATGLITTLAGNGTSGYAGDGNAASGARLNIPLGIWVDNSGNLFVADNANNRIRKIYVNLTSPPPSLPSITITASSTSTCSGNPITFTASVTNGTPNMIYQWYRNNSNVGSNSNQYTTSSLANGDIISCTLTSASCNGVVAISSNAITITGMVTPSITITASATTVCPGTTVQYSAVAVNAGASPTYQWKVNSLNVGSNSATYTRVVSTSGENITCELTADPTFTCASTSTVYSNQIGMTVTVGVAGHITITASDNDICPGTPVTFTATVQNAGSTPSYQWQVNGTAAGANQPTFTSTTLSNQDAVRCMLTSVSNTCIPAPVVSAPVNMIIKTVPAISVFPADTLVATGSAVQLHAQINGSYATYEWSPAVQLANPLSLDPRTLPVRASTEFRLQVMTADGCRVSAKSVITIQSKLFMPNAFTPNGDGRNDVFRIPPGTAVKLESFTVYDRWGNRVFYTTDIHTGWNGTYHGRNKEPGTYIFVVIALDGPEKLLLRGSCMLIR
jgi:gliding motility-associated-like protein